MFVFPILFYISCARRYAPGLLGRLLSARSSATGNAQFENGHHPGRYRSIYELELILAANLDEHILPPPPTPRDHSVKYYTNLVHPITYFTGPVPPPPPQASPLLLNYCLAVVLLGRLKSDPRHLFFPS